jgi:hypothetical protein
MYNPSSSADGYCTWNAARPWHWHFDRASGYQGYSACVRRSSGHGPESVLCLLPGTNSTRTAVGCMEISFKLDEKAIYGANGVADLRAAVREGP